MKGYKKIVYQAYPVGCKNWVSVRQVMHETYKEALEMAQWYLTFGHKKVKVISIELPSEKENLMSSFTAR